jgi:UDP-N-acetylglucosamine 2-epimerase (non-hydrolysing)
MYTPEQIDPRSQCGHDAARRGSRGPVMVCLGTSAEVIKLAPVLEAFATHDALDPIVVTHAEHEPTLDATLATFGITPDHEIARPAPLHSLHDLTSATITALGDVIQAVHPSAVLVQGDSTTAFCAALAAAYAGVPVAHVEAGLRSGDRSSPFPEELNRRAISALADVHLCPTAAAAENLLEEGVGPLDVFVTGNTVVDSLHRMRALSWNGPPLADVPERRCEQRIVVTMHRRETRGDVQRELLRMLARVVDGRSEVEIVMPVHLHHDVRQLVVDELGGCDRIHLTAPLDYRSFVSLLQTADLILTDSGGLQEEGPALSIPVLVMRDATERPEGIEAGGVRLCGTDAHVVEEIVLDLLDDPGEMLRMAASPNPYGDGFAAPRIAQVLAGRLTREHTTEQSELT